jgi:hypothetical protein
MSNQKSINDLVKAISGQASILTIPRIYVNLLAGDLKAALLLNQAVFWSDKTRDPDGWFYKSYAEWEQEITLSQYEVKRASETLKVEGLLEVKLKKANNAPTLHYRVNLDAVTDRIMKKLNNPIMKELDNGLSRNLINLDYEETSQSLTEEYQNNTTEDLTLAADKSAARTPAKQGDYIDCLMKYGQPKTEGIPVQILQYPPDCQPILEKFYSLWHIIPPAKPAKGKGNYALWILDCRALRDACGELGLVVLDRVYQEWLSSKDRYMVARPGAIIKGARACAGVMRGEQGGEPAPTPAAYEALASEIRQKRAERKVQEEAGNVQ